MLSHVSRAWLSKCYFNMFNFCYSVLNKIVIAVIPLGNVTINPLKRARWHCPSHSLKIRNISAFLWSLTWPRSGLKTNVIEWPQRRRHLSIASSTLPGHLRLLQLLWSYRSKGSLIWQKNTAQLFRPFNWQQTNVSIVSNSYRNNYVLKISCPKYNKLVNKTGTKVFKQKNKRETIETNERQRTCTWEVHSQGMSMVLYVYWKLPLSSRQLALEFLPNIFLKHVPDWWVIF